ADDVRGLLTQNLGAVECKPDENKLIITDTLSRVDKIKRFLEEKDSTGRKVEYQVKLVHITLNAEHLGGVDWQGIVEGYERLWISGVHDFLDGDTPERARPHRANADQSI
ncbi:MAG: hypothetical protein HQL19_08145, partial [Candidatus Omnitrophica bacterium]|nr:hypothetical protein [Candidatus Omnitrophota bacterium]